MCLLRLGWGIWALATISYTQGKGPSGEVDLYLKLNNSI